jgi:hypothetical protein
MPDVQPAETPAHALTAAQGTAPGALVDLPRHAIAWCPCTVCEALMERPDVAECATCEGAGVVADASYSGRYGCPEHACGDCDGAGVTFARVAA